MEVVYNKIEIYDQYLLSIYRILCICPYRINLVLNIINRTEYLDLKQNLIECYNFSLSGKKTVNSEILYRCLVQLFRYYDRKKYKKLKKKLING